MDMRLDKAHEMQLEMIFNEALNHAHKCVENESPHSAGEWIDIAMDADHILRKHCMEQYTK